MHPIRAVIAVPVLLAAACGTDLPEAAPGPPTTTTVVAPAALVAPDPTVKPYVLVWVAAATATTTTQPPPPPPEPEPSSPPPAPAAAPEGGHVNGHACGGSLPPCYVLARESGGNPTAENPTSTASGLWQFLDGTWGGYGGYSHASHAPVAVQNERARQLWAGGAGCSHWSAC